MLKSGCSALMLLVSACAADSNGGPPLVGELKSDASNAPAGPHERICDGTQELTFGYAVMDPLDRIPLGLELVEENGSSYLYVDGRCNYWASLLGATRSRLTPIRVGILSDSDEEQLMKALRYQEWSVIKDMPDGPTSGFDMPQKLFTDGENIVRCVACAAGTPFYEMKSSVERMLSSLYMRGQPATGAVRVLARDLQPNPRLVLPLTPWPLESVDPADLLSEPRRFGAGHYVDGVDQTQALRKLRDAQKDLALGSFNGVPVQTADARMFEIFVRDALQYEDDTGLVLTDIAASN